MLSKVFAVLCFTLTIPVYAASPDPIQLSADNWNYEAFVDSKGVLLEELSADGRYGPMPERHKRKIRAALDSIETMLVNAEETSGTHEAIRAEVGEINDILAKADRKVGRGRCEERKPIGSNIRLKTVCRDSERMREDREAAKQALQGGSHCQAGNSGACGMSRKGPGDRPRIVP